MSASKPSYITEKRVFGFGLNALRKYKELIPLVTILGMACTMGTGYMAYSLYQKPDVAVMRDYDSPPWERLNPGKSQKLLNFEQTYQEIPELEKLRMEIGSYKY